MNQLYKCPECGHVDSGEATDTNGHWEKGISKDGNEIFECFKCGKRNEMKEVNNDN